MERKEEWITVKVHDEDDEKHPSNEKEDPDKGCVTPTVQVDSFPFTSPFPSVPLSSSPSSSSHILSSLSPPSSPSLSHPPVLPTKTMSDLLRELANLQIEEPLLTSTASLLATQGIDVELLQNGEVSGEEMKELGIGIGVVKKLLRLKKS